MRPSCTKPCKVPLRCGTLRASSMCLERLPLIAPERATASPAASDADTSD